MNKETEVINKLRLDLCIALLREIQKQGCSQIIKNDDEQKYTDDYKVSEITLRNYFPPQITLNKLDIFSFIEAGSITENLHRCSFRRENSYILKDFDSVKILDKEMADGKQLVTLDVKDIKLAYKEKKARKNDRTIILGRIEDFLCEPKNEEFNIILLDELMKTLKGLSIAYKQITMIRPRVEWISEDNLYRVLFQVSYKDIKSSEIVYNVMGSTYKKEPEKTLNTLKQELSKEVVVHLNKLCSLDIFDNESDREDLVHTVESFFADDYLKGEY